MTYANIIYNGTILLLYYIITGNFYIRIFENTVNTVYICEFNFDD